MKNICQICSIPIYQCDQDKYNSELNKIINGNSHPESHDQCRQHLLDKYGPWKYNEIVGYLSLYIENNTLFVDHWHSNTSSRVFSGKKRTVSINNSQHRIHKVSLLSCNTNQQCHDLISNNISSLIKSIKSNTQQKPPLKNRFFDIAEFEVICQHLDWISLKSA
jgi:hypothetical protein